VIGLLCRFGLEAIVLGICALIPYVQQKRRRDDFQLRVTKPSKLITVFSFLVYGIYWGTYTVFWVYNLTFNIATFLLAMNIVTLQSDAIIVQEYSASAGYFLALIGAILVVHCTVLFIKNDKKYLDRLDKALFFETIFFLLLIPSSLHHLLGIALSRTLSDA
jgi:hypothetical protein